MRRSLALRSNPTVRQTQAILGRLERGLTERGAMTHREVSGEVAFRMPPPWRLARGWLALISSGTASLSAWGGGPWRVSYRLHFGALQALSGLVTLIIVVVGWSWSRLALLAVVLALWGGGYGVLHLLASHAFRDLLRRVMGDFVENRAAPRPHTTDAAAGSQQPE
jgi:hypothetical protein